MDGKDDFFVIKAKEDGVNVIGLTRGTDTRFIILKNWTKAK